MCKKIFLYYFCNCYGFLHKCFFYFSCSLIVCAHSIVKICILSRFVNVSLDRICVNQVRSISNLHPVVKTVLVIYETCSVLRSTCWLFQTATFRLTSFKSVHTFWWKFITWFSIIFFILRVFLLGLNSFFGGRIFVMLTRYFVIALRPAPTIDVISL